MPQIPLRARRRSRQFPIAICCVFFHRYIRTRAKKNTDSQAPNFRDCHGSLKACHNDDIKIKYASRRTTRRSICHCSSVMQDILQYIDLDYYRSAQLLIARAEIAQLRRQSSALARAEQTCGIPAGASRPVDDFDQGAHATPIVQSASPEMNFSRSRNLDH